jgi:hypothetical protein
LVVGASAFSIPVITAYSGTCGTLTEIACRTDGELRVPLALGETVLLEVASRSAPISNPLTVFASELPAPTSTRTLRPTVTPTTTPTGSPTPQPSATASSTATATFAPDLDGNAYARSDDDSNQPGDGNVRSYRHGRSDTHSDNDLTDRDCTTHRTGNAHAAGRGAHGNRRLLHRAAA